MDTARRKLRGYLSLLVFLASYLMLTVVGNALYFLPDSRIGGRFILGFSIHDFATAGSPTYWTLLLLPFVVAPPVALATRRLFQGASVSISLPEFGKPEYAIIIGAAYCYAAASMWNADAIGLLGQNIDFNGVTNSRIELQNALGYWPQATLKSVLIFLSCYGMVKALRSPDAFWKIATLVNLLCMSVLLVLLNMKWPVMIFYAALLLTTLLYAPRYPLMISAALACLMLGSYQITSIGTARVLTAFGQKMPVIVFSPDPTAPAQPKIKQSPTVDPASAPAQPKIEPASAIAANAFAAILNRMAQPFPYYVDTFSREGQKCGTILDRIIRIPSPCHPSNVIYAKMFKDEFADVGTAPQSVHVTGYALGSWPGALLELILASIVIGAFMAVSRVPGSTAATFTIMGGLTGYYFSQLPFEGPIVYDHGLLGWGLLVAAMALKHRLSSGWKLPNACTLPET